jgi:hypothetical protein
LRNCFYRIGHDILLIFLEATGLLLSADGAIQARKRIGARLVLSALAFKIVTDVAKSFRVKGTDSLTPSEIITSNSGKRQLLKPEEQTVPVPLAGSALFYATIARAGIY